MNDSIGTRPGKQQPQPRRRLGQPVLYAISFALIAASARAEGADRFDLVCNGTVTALRTTSSEDATTTAAWDGRVRVDLGRGKACVDDCQIVETVSASDPSEIELLSVGAETSSPQRREYVDRIEVNRISGQYSRTHDWAEDTRNPDMANVSIIHHDEYSGACTPGQFSGLPRASF